MANYVEKGEIHVFYFSRNANRPGRYPYREYFY